MLTYTKTLFHIRQASVLALILTVGLAFAQSEESALKMVKALNLGDNLGRMSYQMSKVTTTYQGIAAKVGPQKADEMLRAELATSVPKYQEQWDRNLARAWAPLMSRDEIESIASQRQQSPFSAKFMSLQNQAGASMKIKSEPVLTAVMTEALTRVFDKTVASK